MAAPFQLTLLPQLCSLQLLGTDRVDNTVYYRIRCRGNVFPTSVRLFLLVKNMLHSNGRRSVVCFAAVA
jgi:hypothetical protein